MALNGLNAAAAVAILNNARVDDETRTRGVILAAFVPGPLGLAVPFVLAQQAGASVTGTDGTDTDVRESVVPEVVGLSPEDAKDKLNRAGLVAVVVKVFSESEVDK